MRGEGLGVRGEGVGLGVYGFRFLRGRAASQENIIYRPLILFTGGKYYLQAENIIYRRHFRNNIIYRRKILFTGGFVARK